MDDFLKRVIAQREREQEQELVATPLKAFAPPHCRICAKRLSMTEDIEAGHVVTVCSACGGKKLERRLQKQDAEGQRNVTSDRFVELARALELDPAELVLELRAAWVRNTEAELLEQLHQVQTAPTEAGDGE